MNLKQTVTSNLTYRESRNNENFLLYLVVVLCAFIGASMFITGIHTESWDFEFPNRVFELFEKRGINDQLIWEDMWEVVKHVDKADIDWKLYGEYLQFKAQFRMFNRNIKFDEISGAVKHEIMDRRWAADQNWFTGEMERWDRRHLFTRDLAGYKLFFKLMEALDKQYIYINGMKNASTPIFY